MKTNGAVLCGTNQNWQVEEVELDGPQEHEVPGKTQCQRYVTPTITW